MPSTHDNLPPALKRAATIVGRYTVACRVARQSGQPKPAMTPQIKTAYRAWFRHIKPAKPCPKGFVTEAKVRALRKVARLPKPAKRTTNRLARFDQSLLPPHARVLVKNIRSGKKHWSEAVLEVTHESGMRWHYKLNTRGEKRVRLFAPAAGIPNPQLPMHPHPWRTMEPSEVDKMDGFIRAYFDAMSYKSSPEKAA